MRRFRAADLSPSPMWRIGCGKRDELREFPQVLGGGGQKEFIFSSVWPAQTQSVQPKDALQMCEQHLDLLSLATEKRRPQSCDCAGHVAGVFVNVPRDLACRRVRTALGLEHAGVAVVLAARSSGSCRPSSPRRAAGRTRDDISSALCRQGKHSGCPLDRGRSRCGERSVRALGLVDQFHVRFDSTLVHQPPDHLGRAVAPVGDQA